jgi:hypothetical protein
MKRQRKNEWKKYNNKIINQILPLCPNATTETRSHVPLCTYPTTPISFGKLTEHYQFGDQEKKE